MRHIGSRKETIQSEHLRRPKSHEQSVYWWTANLVQWYWYIPDADLKWKRQESPSFWNTAPPEHVPFRQMYHQQLCRYEHPDTVGTRLHRYSEITFNVHSGSEISISIIHCVLPMLLGAQVLKPTSHSQWYHRHPTQEQIRSVQKPR